MAVLENIRVKLGVFITILIALSLLSFIIDPSTLSTTFQRMSADNKVGSMNGKTINYQEYYTAVEQNKNLFESLYGQSLSSEEQLSEVRDYTWQNFFDKYVFEPKAADAGIAVGDQEIYDLTQGANISPVLMSQSAFLDENGNFSREALSQFIQNIDYDATGTYAATRSTNSSSTANTTPCSTTALSSTSSRKTSPSRPTTSPATWIS